jgi:hypothetical protein
MRIADVVRKLRQQRRRRNAALRERILIQSKFESLIAPAICNERASAKPAGDKQAKACLDYSAPSSQLC